MTKDWKSFGSRCRVEGEDELFVERGRRQCIGLVATPFPREIAQDCVAPKDDDKDPLS